MARAIDDLFDGPVTKPHPEGYGLTSQKAMTDPLIRYISQNLRTGQGT
jgi:hypothetical protein